MQIDIDRLHKVADGTLVGRHQGHTLLSVTMLAALISTEEPIVYCSVDKYAETEYIFKMIVDVCRWYELPPIDRIGRLHFKCWNTKVFFVFNDTIAILRGIPEKVPLVTLYEK